MSIEKKMKLRKVWDGMKARCNNPNDKDYKDYGARGIRVCPEWMGSSDAFVAWGLSNGYTEGLTIDRTDNSNGYSPSNCRWVTRAEQNLNRRMQKSNTSGIVGVYWNKPANKWRAQIDVDGKRHHIGYFNRSIAAAAARNQYILDHDLPHNLHTITMETAK